MSSALLSWLFSIQFMGCMLCWQSVPSESFQLSANPIPVPSRSNLNLLSLRGRKSSCVGRFSTAITMLRRQDRQADDSEFSGESKSTTLSRSDDSKSKEISDFSGWRISSKKKLPGICDLADEIENWLLRVELTSRKDGGLDEAGRAIVAEFENSTPKDSQSIRVGGAGGEMSVGQVESWFKDTSGRDNDPSGAIRRGEGHLREAERLNLTYVDYIKTYVKKPILPTVEVVRPHRRQLPDGIEQLVTMPHSYPVYTQLPRVPYSTCWYGLFFEVEARDRDIEIAALYTQTGIYHSERRDLVNVTVYTREGGAAGFELSRDAWDVAGQLDNARLVRVNFTTNTDPQYGKLPLDAPLKVKAGTRRGFLVHTTQDRGIALRARPSGVWIAGDVTDSDGNVAVRAGLLPCGDDIYEHKLSGGSSLSSSVFTEVFSKEYGGAFVGIVDYRFL